MPMPDIICTVILIMSGIPVVYFDIKDNTIPNFITYVGILLGFFMLVFFRKPDFLNYAGAFMLGFGLFYIFFLMGWVGGGDVKLMGMTGILMGMEFLISVFIYTAIAGGIIAAGYALWRLIKRKSVLKSRIPYGTAIIVGIYYAIYTQTLATHL